MSRRPRLLDLFACQGGASAGYMAAGFEVTAVDLNGRALARNPADYKVQDDALGYLAAFGHTFDAIAASPPCQDHSSLASVSGPHGTGHLLGDTLKLLRRDFAHVPWAVENVVGAPMPGALQLCGTEFGLGTVCDDGVYRQLRRHRLFLSSVDLWGAGGCACSGRAVLVAGVYGHGGARPDTGIRRGYQANKGEATRLLGTPWMTQNGQAQCIPPAYAAFIGEQLVAARVLAPAA